MTIAKALQYLAEKYQFELSFPKNLDQPVQLEDAMPLDQMIKFLTRDFNTALQHKKITGCKTPRLAELIIMPTGEATEFISVETSPPAQQPVETLVIEDMDAYAEEVLLKKRKSGINKMTDEQKIVYREARKRIKKQLMDEGRLNKKEKNKEKLTKEERRLKREEGKNQQEN